MNAQLSTTSRQALQTAETTSPNRAVMDTGASAPARADDTRCPQPARSTPGNAINDGIVPERIADNSASPIELLRTILRYAPRDYIPVCAPFGRVALGLVGPANRFECMYDPLRAMLSDPVIVGYHVDSDTESSGSVTSAIATTAGVLSQCRVARQKWDTDPDQSGADEALTTVTWAPEDLNAHGVSFELTTTGFGAAVTDASLTARFTLPAGNAGGVWWHFARRVTGLPKCVPSRAFLSTPIASGEGLTATASFAVTGLTSGNLMKQTVSAMSVASPYFIEYAEYMLRNYYERL